MNILLQNLNSQRLKKKIVNMCLKVPFNLNKFISLTQMILLAIGVGCVAARTRYVFKIQSVLRAAHSGVGNLLKVELDQSGVPAKLSVNGSTSSVVVCCCCHLIFSDVG